MEEKVYKIFKELGIEYEKVEHPPMYTCADHDRFNIKMNGMFCKNLFIRNQNKSHFYLVALPAEKRADLKILQEKLEDSKLSFGSEESLYKKLGSTTGAVSILNIIEIEKTDVKVIIDKSLLTADKVTFHPNVNTVTLSFSPHDIGKIMKKYNICYEFIDL